MAREEFKTAPLPFLCRGLQLAKPLDQLAPGEFARLTNVRSYILGSLQSRDGTDNLGTPVAGQSPVHSIRRLNDSLNNTWTRLYGTGTHLAVGQSPTTATDLGGGWSGNPLALVPWRPTESPVSWMYAADSSKMAKVNSAGTQHGVGIPFVNTAPTIRIADAGVAPPLATGGATLTYAPTGATTNWTKSGTAGTISLLSAGPGYRINTTITSIFYANGAGPGVCTIVPASITGINQDCQVGFPAHSELQRVLQVLPTISTTTISAILYDSGTTGNCSIALAASSLQILKGCVVQIGTGGTQDTVIVNDVVVSPQGQYSIRVNTAHNHVATEAVVGLAAFQVATQNTYSAGATLQTDGLTSTISTGTGLLTYTAAQDLVTIPAIGNFQPDDYIHTSLMFDVLDNLTEGKILFDISDGSFDKDYYYYPFRANDLAASAANTQTFTQAKTIAITNTQVDSSGIHQPASTLYPYTAAPVNPPYAGLSPPSPLNALNGYVGGIDTNVGAPNQTQLGNATWIELSFRFSDLIRSGTNLSLDLRNIQAIGVQVTVTGSTQLSLDSAWRGGFFGPDVGTLGQPYVYRVQYRASSTGARSPFTPPTRSGAVPRRMPVEIDFTSSPTAEVDKADVYRFGGTLLQWTYVGTAQNSAGKLIDVQSDTAIAQNPIGNPDFYQPWPVEDQPKLGTTGTVAGSTIADSGTSFNTAWAQGVLILINGTACTIYRVISTSLLEIYENQGAQSAVTWEVPDPILMAQSLPCLWGPFENFFFACGDPKNPGRLYFSTGNDPDSTQEEYWIDITGPSEPLMNGYLYNGTCYVRTSERRFRIYPTFGQFNLIDPTIPGPGLFRAIEVPDGKGLFMRWGYCVGPQEWEIGRDGIYQSEGAAPSNITNDDLLPIFPHEGSVGFAVNGYNPPNLVQAQATNHRLAYYDSCLYYDYVDTLGNRCTLIRKMPAPTDKQATPTGWWFDSYTPGAIMHYGEEGQNIHSMLTGNSDGTVSQYDATVGQDGTNAIACEFRTGSNDLGDTRLKKIFGDLNFDCNTNNIPVTVGVGFDNYASGPITSTITTATRQPDPPIIDVNNGFLARNIAIDAAWSQTSANPDVICYSWTPTAIPKPENIELRASDWDDSGYQGNKFFQGCIIEANTYGVTKTLQIQGDAGLIELNLQINHDGQVEIPYSWPPFLAHQVRVEAQDTAPWEIFSIRWVFNPAPESVLYWETQTRPINGHGYGHMRDGYATVVSTAPITYTVIIDGVTYSVYDGDTGQNTIASTGGVQLKKYLIFPAVKGKIVRHNLTSVQPFMLFMDSSEVHVRSWGQEGPYETLKPFGDLSDVTGARI